MKEMHLVCIYTHIEKKYIPSVDLHIHGENTFLNLFIPACGGNAFGLYIYGERGN